MAWGYEGLEAGRYGVGLQRGALFSILDAAWPGRAGALHAGCDIVDVDADNGLLHDACGQTHGPFDLVVVADGAASRLRRSEEHTSELQSLMRISYAVFCWKKKKNDLEQLRN